MRSDDEMDGLLIERLDTIDSTSLHARRLIQSCLAGATLHPRIILARTQTSGVGQRGRVWCSPPGGLWCTFVLPWCEPLCCGILTGSTVGTLGIRIGLACVRTIEHALTGAGGDGLPNDAPAAHRDTPMLKLPNDVFVAGRKVLGVLTEIVAGAGTTCDLTAAHTPRVHQQHDDSRMRYVLIGVGINANLDVCDLAPAVARTATSLRELLARETNLDWLLNVLSRNVLAALETGRLDSCELDAVAARLYARGTSARIRALSGDVIKGTLEGVNADGLVVVRNGEESHAGSLVSEG